MAADTHVAAEIASQPDCWRRAAEVAERYVEALPRAGERVAAVGCGTSWFIGQAYAKLREHSCHRQTDAFAASEMDRTDYDRVVAITRSGTTTEVLELLEHLRGHVPTVVITASSTSPAVDVADHVITLGFADERALVQTRFATTTLALLRAHLGADLSDCMSEAERAVTAPLPAGVSDRSQFTFLGRGWAAGLANEAALKMREAALAWSESYPALEYRHGPISITDERSVVWFFGDPPEDLPKEATAAGALAVRETGDPMAELVLVQRLAVEMARAKGLDPDHPRNLARSVILPSGKA